MYTKFKRVFVSEEEGENRVGTGDFRDFTFLYNGLFLNKIGKPI